MDHPKDHSLFGLGLPGYIYIYTYIYIYMYINYKMVATTCRAFSLGSFEL